MVDIDPLAMLLGQPEGMQPVAPSAPTAAPAAGDPRNTGTGGWSAWLQNPANRAFLISAGAQMLQPSFGGAMANMGQALAQGEEARSGTIRTQQEMDFARDQLDQRSREGAANRANQLRVAEIGAESRLDVASLRSNAMLQRAQMIGARTPGAANQYSNLVQRFFQTLTRDNPVAGAGRQSADQLFERAMQMADDAMKNQHGNLLTPGGNTPGTTTPGITVPPSANSTTTPGSRTGTTTPPATTPTPSAAPTQVIPGQGLLRFGGPLGMLTEQLLRRSPPGAGIPPAQTPQLSPESSVPQTSPGTGLIGGSAPRTFEEFMARPGAETWLNVPENRRRLMIAYPSWAPRIRRMYGE